MKPNLRLLPAPSPAPSSQQLVLAAIAAVSAINAMHGCSTDKRRRVLFAAGERLEAALGTLSPSLRRRALPKRQQERVDASILAVAEYALLDIGTLLGPSRVHEVVDARDLLVYVLSHELALRPNDVGRQVNRDHSSVLTSLDRGAKKLETEWFVAGLRQVRQALGISPAREEVSR